VTATDVVALDWPALTAELGELGCAMAEPLRARLGRPGSWPEDFDGWLAQGHAAGQDRPTPILMRPGPGDWNALVSRAGAARGQHGALGRRHTLGLVMHDAR